MNTSFSWLGNILALLKPSISRCLTCGKESPPSVHLPGICKLCEEAIPWIRTPRCLQCGRHIGCPDCTRSSEPSPMICNRSAVAYTPVMREWLGQYKYRGNERYAPLLGLMLDRAYVTLKAERQQNSFQSCQRYDSWSADLLVPVPVSDSRLMERGFNQAERLAHVLSQQRKILLLPLLIRTHHTGKQSFKGRAERFAAMKHAFGENPAVTAALRSLLKEKDSKSGPVQIIVVDDIYTTGSTIRACAEVIKQITSQHGYEADVFSLTWARS